MFWSSARRFQSLASVFQRLTRVFQGLARVFTYLARMFRFSAGGFCWWASLFEVPVLPAGAVGTVVDVYGKGAGYEVEFVSDAGDTLALVTLSPAQVRPAGLPEVARGTVTR